MGKKRIRRTPQASPEIRTSIRDDYGSFTGSYASPTLSGTSITTETAMTIAAFWQAVNIYANTIASLDLYVAERDRRGGRRPAYDHPIYDLLHLKPNRLMTSFHYRQTVVSHSLTFGNSYSEIEFGDDGYPVQLHLLDPRNVNPCIHDDGTLHYRLTREKIDLPDWKVLHFHGMAFDGIRGHSPVHMARNSLGLAVAQENYQASLMGNMGVPTGYLKYPNKITDQQRGQLRDQWNKLHQGSERAGNVGILDGGLEWVSTQFSPADAEVITSRNFSIGEIARLFLLPPHMLGVMDSATFSNIEEQNKQFYQYSLQPRLKSMEQEIEAKLLGPDEHNDFFIRHDEKDLLRGNLAAQTSYNQAMFNMGGLSINELRLDAGMDPIDDPSADKHWIPVNNLMSIEDMDKQLPIPSIDLDPDDATDDDTAPDTMPEQPNVIPPGTLDAIRATIADPIGRMIRRECQAIRAASKKDDFAGWLDTYYPRHHDLVVESVAPSLRVLSLIEGKDHDPKRLADDMVRTSLDAIRGLVSCFPPDELPEQVDRLASHWEAGRARELTEALAKGDG